MTRTTRTVLGVVSSAVIVTAHGASAQSASDPAIVKVADAYRQAVVGGDVKSIVALYTDDAVEMPPNEPAVKGRAAIENYYKKQLGDPAARPTDLTFTHLEATAVGDRAYDVGTYSQTMTIDGKTVKDTGKYVVILKQVGGQWRVAYAIYNSDQPPMAKSGGL